MASNYVYVKKCIEERRKWINGFKADPCNRCKKCFHPVCMDFHHIDPTTKEFEIGSNSFRCSRERTLKEMAKCVLLCANCHRLTEYEKHHPQVLEKEPQCNT